MSEDYPKTGEQWQAFVFDPGANRLKKLDQLAEMKCRQNLIQAEELQTLALDALSANNWVKLTGFKGRSSPETYLIKVYSNILIDQWRKIFGRCRAPQWVIQAGEEWVLAHELLCCEKHHRDEVIARCCSKYQLATSGVKQLIRDILAKVTDCGGILRPSAEAEQILDDPERNTMAISSDTGDADYEALVHTLASLLEDQTTETWDILRQQVTLTNEQITILKLKFNDHMSEQKIANQYQKTRDQVRSVIKKSLTTLNQALQRAGVSAEDVRDWPIR